MDPQKTKNGYGGARPGSGRKKLTESGQVKAAFSLQQDEVDALAMGAEKAGLNKSRFLAECIKFWNENH